MNVDDLTHDATAHDATAHDATTYDATTYDATAHDATTDDVITHDATAYDATAHDATAHDLAGSLAHAFAGTSHEQRALHDRLAAEAGAGGLLDVAYRTLDSPIGTLLLAATGQGLVRIAFATEGHDRVLQSLADRISPRVLDAPARLDPAATELDEYFAGRRSRFDLPLDWRLSQGFRRTVLHHLIAEVGYGRTATYRTLAGLAGNPRAVRAVGSACATNPLPVVVPCHRVLRTDGGLGGYLGGLDAKRLLLDLERAS
jgi:methylated-DNA-[protein]-cysteine S-methyltransferase